ncbi:flavin reductase family protein [Acrocarpospora corrugata]|uniref:flavin reductase family protein n=1 Tax=Acrocarpospora corrugata TaxID=35763 RepID=UPI0012D315FF|nr:flavin reductase family protein [Acrocarpospora corrugata]
MADQKILRRAFGRFATGVTVVTVGGTAPHGMTANSFTSVSLDPPLVLICVDRSAIMHGMLPDAGSFGVNVLAADQEGLAKRFADRWRVPGLAQFENVDWFPGTLTGAPMLNASIARFECEVWRTYDGGDHSIFIGKVLSHDEEAEEALLFFNGRFRQIDLSEVRT